MAPQPGPNHRPGQRGPVFKEISWLQRWPRLVATGFILLILVEILIFVWVADHIGLGLTLLALLGSATLGLWLIRRTGLDMIGRLRLALARGQEPGHSLVDGACFVIAGMLLIVPGFFTDLLAIVFMLPWSRNWLIRRFAGAFGEPMAPGGRGTVITDVEFHEVVIEEEPGARAETGGEEPSETATTATAEIFVPARPDRSPQSTSRPNVIDVETEAATTETAAETAIPKRAASGSTEDAGDARTGGGPAAEGTQKKPEKEAREKKEEKPGDTDWTAAPRRPIIDVPIIDDEEN